MVIFTSNNNLLRAENLNAVYSAYNGEKEFFHTNPWGAQPDFSSGKYSLRVADELINASPGRCIFIGHGMGAFKKYGLDQPNPYFHSPNLVTYAIASSKHMVPIVSKQIGIAEDRVLPIGMPRTDAYFTPKVKNDKRIYLYLPTFRNRAENANMRVDWEYLDNNLTDNELLVVKPHMVTKKILKKEYKHIVQELSNIPTTDFLLSADIVITDYSSVIFDAYVCKIPVVLFEKDHETYMANRGVYMTYPGDYSPYHCRSEDDLLAFLRNAEWGDVFERHREFYTGACDGNSTKRVIDLIERVLRDENFSSGSNI